MAQGRQRRLAAILMLDVVGYSRMMADDEAGALNRVLALREAFLHPKITEHDGRVVKVMGDGALVEFASVTDAVRCAIEIQAGMAEQSGALAPDQRIELRIGINLGEVIVEGDDIYGDGVNVAARVEALAIPGGVAITAAVAEHLRTQLPIRLEDGGDVEVKNIPNPIRIFHVHPAEKGAHNAGIHTRPAPRQKNTRTRILVVITCFAVVFGGAWWVWRENTGTFAPSPALTAAAEKPSVVVMPFDNLSGDPEQSYFSDGMADNLITDLSRVSELLVIARNTSFSFRDRQEDMDARSIGKTLGVRYVVEGSVQRASEHVRINVNLIDAQTGLQIWAGRLDREFKDLFALQDEVAERIIDALEVELTQEERRQLAKRYTNSLEAYDLYLRAWEEIWRYNEAGRIDAQVYLRKALKLDPEFALALGLLATSYTNRNGVSLRDNPAQLEQALELAEKALAMDPDLPEVLAAISTVYLFRSEFDKAEAVLLRALDIDPNYADGYALLAWVGHYAGDPEKALAGFDHALMLNPRPPFPYLNAIAEIHFSLENYEDSVRTSEIAVERNPGALRQRLFLAAAYAKLGQIDDAEWEIEEALALQPKLSLSNIRAIAPYRKAETLEHLIQALREAGLPE